MSCIPVLPAPFPLGPAQDTWLLHPYLVIYLKNIHRIKHASDTGTYNEQGRMYPSVSCPHTRSSTRMQSDFVGLRSGKHMQVDI